MKEKMLEILAEATGADVSELEPDLDLFESGALDSFGVIMLFVEIENGLGVKIEPTEVPREAIATVEKLIAFVESKAG